MLRTPLEFGLYNALPDPLAGFKGSLRGVEGRDRGRGRRGAGREGKDVGSDAKWLPNCLNRKPIGIGGGGVEP